MIDNTCLEGLVGLRNPCTNEDDGCLYVNDLPGIQLKSFANIANEEDVTAKKAFERIHREAMLQVEKDFLTKLSKSVQVLDKIDSDIIGRFDRDKMHGNDNQYYGIEVNKSCFDDELKACIDWVSIYSDTATEIELNIETDGELKVKNVSLRKGENRIKVGAVGYDIKVYFLSDGFSFASASSASYCQRNCDELTCYEYGFLTSLNGINFDKGSIAPFVVCLSCKCDKNAFICHYADSLKYALRWKIAALLMEEIIYSERKSSFVRNSKDEAKKMLAKIYGMEDPETGFPMKSQYWISIEQTIHSTPVPQSVCIDCVGAKIVDSIP